MAPLVATGQQIGVGWTPALSVVKAMAAWTAARRLGGEAIYWLADEDHDHLEVASTVALRGRQIQKHRFRFQAPAGTATGWLPWTAVHQQEAAALWGPVPEPTEPSLRGHVLALGAPLWQRGLRPFSPTQDVDRWSLQDTFQRWRSLGLEDLLEQQALRLRAEGATLPLDPATQAAWFSLHPHSGLRQRLERGTPCPADCWLSPGAALRPLFQSLVLPVTHVVLGPAERAYWRLTEPLWSQVGLVQPQIIPRPSAFRIPQGIRVDEHQLSALQTGDWSAFSNEAVSLPSSCPLPEADPLWPPAVSDRFRQELSHLRQRMARLDRRLARAMAAKQLQGDPEEARQILFPLGRPQERVLPGLFWLRDPGFMDALAAALDGTQPVSLIQA